MTLLNKSGFVAFLGVVTSIWLLRPLAIRIGLVDRPGGRKVHEGDIPLIGGIGIFIGFMFAILLLQISLSPYRSFIAASGLLVFVGILDDFHELTARDRLISQIMAVLLMTVWGDNTLLNLGNLLFWKDIYLGWFAIPVTIIGVVGIINAVNMLDGVDGLAASLGLMQLLLLSLLAYMVDNFEALRVLLILCFALSGFLFFNLRFALTHKIRVFMGDAGSMFIGFSLSWFLVCLSQNPAHPISAVTMLWIMAIPLFDTLRVMIHRIKHKRSPFSPGRDHIHHFLEEKGYHPIQINLILSMATLILGFFGIWGAVYHVAEGLMFMLFLGLFILYYGFIRHGLACKA